MRLAFVGATRLGLRCLEAVTTISGCEVVGAVTAPRDFAISYRPQGVRNVLFADIGDACRARGIAWVVMERGMQDQALLARVRAWQPEAFLVAGWYHMVPRRWREVAPAFGLHASLLPDYSGGAPLVWAIINGETRTGITLFRLGDGVDDGPIVGQIPTDILPEDTIASLYERVEGLAVELVRRYVPRLADGSAPLTPQDESRRRSFPQRGPEDGVIDWSQPAKRVHDFVRAQTRPYPGAFTFFGARKVVIWRSRLTARRPLDDVPCGHFSRGETGATVVRCGDRTELALEQVGGPDDCTAADSPIGARLGSESGTFSNSSPL